MRLACNYIFMLPMCAVDEWRPECRRFEWQEGDGAFTGGDSDVLVQLPGAWALSDPELQLNLKKLRLEPLFCA